MEESGKSGRRGIVGPFSQAIDLVQSEYGWSDERVLSLSLGRLRQVVEVISERQLALAKERWSHTVWQTRQICGFIGATVDVDTSKTGGVNPLVEAARDIGKEFLFEDERPAVPEPGPEAPLGVDPEDTAVSVGQASPDELEAARVAQIAEANPMGAVRLFASKIGEGKPE